MTTLASAAAPTATSASPLLGVGPMTRKELLEWWRSRRAIVLFVVTTPIVALNVLSARLAVWSAQISHRPPLIAVSLDPTANVLGKWDQWLFVFAIGMSLSLMVGERDRGTLAWMLSKPVSRTGVLVAKWTAAMIMGSLAGLVLPMAVCVAVAIPAYGMPSLGAVALATVLLLAVPAFFVALTLWLGTVIPSQVGVAGLALVVAVVPGIVGSVAPEVAAALPPSIGPWAVATAMGASVSATSPIGWAAGMALVAALGVRAIGRLEL